MVFNFVIILLVVIILRVAINVKITSGSKVASKVCQVVMGINVMNFMQVEKID